MENEKVIKQIAHRNNPFLFGAFSELIGETRRNISNIFPNIQIYY